MLVTVCTNCSLSPQDARIGERFWCGAIAMTLLLDSPRRGGELPAYLRNPAPLPVQGQRCRFSPPTMSTSASTIIIACLMPRAMGVYHDMFSAPSRHIGAQPSIMLEDHRRNEDQHHTRHLSAAETYSWGAIKTYAVPYSTSHPVGGKTVLFTRYKPSNYDCADSTNGIGLTPEQCQAHGDCVNPPIGQYVCWCESCPIVISHREIDDIVQSGNASIVKFSYGRAWIERVVVVPGLLTVGTSGDYFDEINAAREAAYALGYDFSSYDLDIHWKFFTGGSAGGSANAGGRTQRYIYDGSIRTFTGKVFPHEVRMEALARLGARWARSNAAAACILSPSICPCRIAHVPLFCSSHAMKRSSCTTLVSATRGIMGKPTAIRTTWLAVVVANTTSRLPRNIDGGGSRPLNLWN